MYLYISNYYAFTFWDTYRGRYAAYLHATLARTLVARLGHKCGGIIHCLVRT